MTKRTIQEIINTEHPANDVEAAIRAAYWYGQHVGAKRVCDKYSKIREGQIDRARAVRYHKEAVRVLGTISLIYDGSYGDGEIGTWDFAI